jgi:hypothetical protein
MKKLFSVIFISSPSLCFAEISDKVPSVFDMWSLGLTLGIICLILSYFHKLGLWVSIILTMIILYLRYNLFSDKYFIEPIISEMGKNYILYGYLSSILIIFLGLIGYLLGKKYKKSK